MTGPIQSPFGSPLTKGEKRQRATEMAFVPHGWTRDDDERMLAALADGNTFSQVAAMFGNRSRDACIGRMFRLRHQMGAQAA